MRRFTTILAVALAIIIALPVGWCCRPASASTTDEQAASAPAAEHRACCGLHRPAERSHPTPAAPAVPAGRCCCAMDWGFAPERVGLTNVVDAGLFLALTHPAPVDLVGPVADDTGDIDTGPPRHVLLCVWLC